MYTQSETDSLKRVLNFLHYVFKSYSDEQCVKWAKKKTKIYYKGEITKTAIDRGELLVYAYLLWRTEEYNKVEILAVILRIRGAMADPTSTYANVVNKIHPNEFLERLQFGKEAGFDFGEEEKGNDDDGYEDDFDDEDNDQRMKSHGKRGKSKIGKMQQIMNLIRDEGIRVNDIDSIPEYDHLRTTVLIHQAKLLDYEAEMQNKRPRTWITANEITDELVNESYIYVIHFCISWVSVLFMS